MYVIDGVLLPPIANATVPYTSVAEAVADSPQLSTLLALVAADPEVCAPGAWCLVMLPWAACASRCTCLALARACQMC